MWLLLIMQRSVEHSVYFMVVFIHLSLFRFQAYAVLAMRACEWVRTCMRMMVVTNQLRLMWLALPLLSVTQWGSVTSWLAPTAHSCFISNLDSLSCTDQDKIQNTCNIIRFLHFFFFLWLDFSFFYCGGKYANKNEE